MGLKGARRIPRRGAGRDSPDPQELAASNRRTVGPHALRFLLARNPAALTYVLGVVYRAISGHLL